MKRSTVNINDSDITEQLNFSRQQLGSRRGSATSHYQSPLPKSRAKKPDHLLAGLLNLGGSVAKNSSHARDSKVLLDHDEL